MPQRTLRMRFDEVAVEAAGISLANKSMAAGAATGLAGFLSSVNWVGLTGVLIGAVGLAANIYFQIRRDRRESAESKARVQALRERCGL